MTRPLHESAYGLPLYPMSGDDRYFSANRKRVAAEAAARRARSLNFIIVSAPTRGDGGNV